MVPAKMSIEIDTSSSDILDLVAVIPDSGDVFFMIIFGINDLLFPWVQKRELIILNYGVKVIVIYLNLKSESGKEWK